MSSRTTFFECSSRLSAKTDSHALFLTARHHFESYAQVKPSCAVLKSTVPDNVNVVSSGRLELLLSGHLNGSKISPDTCVKSHLVQYIVSFFRNNLAELGIEHVSDALLDENDQAKVVLTFDQSREPQHPQIPLRVTLQSIHLHLAWNIIARFQVESFESSTIENSLFSEQMSLPIQGLVENAIGRFVTWHMVRRYPLIFGAWNKQLSIEVHLFSKIFHAIVEMVERSANNFFRLKYNNIIKTLRLQLTDALVASRSSLSDYLHSPQDEGTDTSDIHLSDELVFCITMEQLYRVGMKRPQFRGLTDVLMTSSDALDDDTLSHDYSVTARSPSPAVTPQDSLWDLPVFPVSPVQDSDLEDHCSSLSDGKTILEDRPEEFADLHDAYDSPTTGYENYAWISLTRQKRSPPNVLCFGTETGQDDDLELDWRSDSVDSQENYGCGAGEDFEDLSARAEEDNPVGMDIEDTETCSVNEHQMLELEDEVEIGMSISPLAMDENLVIENEFCSPRIDIQDDILD